MANDEFPNDTVVVFRLRSGYEVCFAGDAPGMMMHLQEAIIEESLIRAARNGNSAWGAIVAEIVAECQHVVEGIPVAMARPLLVGLLSDALVARLQPVEGNKGSVRPSAIQ